MQKKKTTRYIEFLVSTVGNGAGEKVAVMSECNDNYYYTDGFDRYCYAEKSEENISYKIVEKVKP